VDAATGAVGAAGSGALTAEIARATLAESTIATNLSTEVTRAIGAELALSAAKQDALSGSGYAKLAGTSVTYVSSIPNADLANNTITINGNPVELGNSTTVTSNTTNALTFDNSGLGAVSGSTFNGGAAQTISYNSIGAVASNSAIAGGTATKITYDSKGLVTLGEVATTADITAAFDKNYVTNDQLGVLASTSGINTGDEDVFTILAKLGDALVALTPGSSLSGINTGDQIITLTGDVTGSGTGSFPATIGTNKVTFSKMQNITTNSILGRSTSGIGNVESISIGSGLSLAGGILSATAPTGDITVGTSALSLGGNYSSLAGLTSVTSTSFIGDLLGNASTVTTNADLTGDVTSNGNTTTIGASKVTNAMLAGSIDLTTKVTGILPIAKGGSGISTVPTNGQLLIGNTTNSNYSLATLTAGSGITITNAAGAITIAQSTTGGAYIPASFRTLTTVPQTSGSSWTVPANITSVTIELLGGSGGGGGGGARTSGSGNAGAGGGGGGGEYVGIVLNVSPGDVISYTLGTAGSGAPTGGATSNGGNGTSGTLSTVTYNGNIILTANGGAGGTGGTASTTNANGTNGSGGAGGSGSSASIKKSGVVGGVGNLNNSGGTGGANGSAVTGGTLQSGGNGGAGRGNTGNSTAGSAGSAGIVVFSYYN
jgi:hypothetical protein